MTNEPAWVVILFAVALFVGGYLIAKYVDPWLEKKFLEREKRK